MSLCLRSQCEHCLCGYAHSVNTVRVCIIKLAAQQIHPCLFNVLSNSLPYKSIRACSMFYQTRCPTNPSVPVQCFIKLAAQQIHPCLFNVLSNSLPYKSIRACSMFYQTRCPTNPSVPVQCCLCCTCDNALSVLPVCTVIP
ncbi:hypothetical protein DPMN_058532 [Dreissena polymorpha]|uniref:Uncharacterized protein n=1 Tax=Dreissena polymorpha TaxID=45954 RepID=A0A9D4HFK1_DREPO|nr:hypothetical protein DPMN_058532 [Dreissena polymorpha]